MKSVTVVEGIALEDVHPPYICDGPCVIHSPTEHHMRGWQLHWRSDRGIFERICPHGVGHPDPDQFEFWKTAKAEWKPVVDCALLDPYPPGNPYDGIGVHGCDGCCTPPTEGENP